jgi:two-component system, OmpR family, response regulator
MRFAIADADPIMADILAGAARRRGHQSVCLAGLDELFERLPFEPTVVVLALEPGPSAVSRLAKVRELFPSAGLLVTIEQPREPLPLALLKAGATEVVRIPYHPVELIVRAETWLAAHASERSPEAALRIGDLEVALDRYSATKAGHDLTLTKLELRLLYCLCEHAPHLTPTERLLTFGWDTLGDPDPTLIKTHISHLRRKLEAAGGLAVCLTSRQTLGYVLTVESEPVAGPATA